MSARLEIRASASPSHGDYELKSLTLMHAKVDFTKSNLVVFAHELRQPLASILLAAQCLNEIVSQDAGTRELGQIVERQSRFLVRIIEEVLEQRHGSAAGLNLRTDWFDLGIVVAGAIEATSSLLKERESRLTVVLPPGQLWIKADPLRIHQVLINLLTNAAKYTERGGRIQLAAEIGAGSIVIRVSDDGVGIPEALLPRIFDLFERGTDPAHHHTAGLGIGLALVKSLVELHNGTITAHSDGAGRGSTFVVCLPEHSSRGPKVDPYRGTYETGAAANHHVETDAMSDA
jgi:signal transduction histidine kinase